MKSMRASRNMPKRYRAYRMSSKQLKKTLRRKRDKHGENKKKKKIREKLKKLPL